MDDDLKALFKRDAGSVPDVDPERREATITAARHLFSEISQETTHAERLTNQQPRSEAKIGKVQHMFKKAFISTRRGILLSATSLSVAGAAGFLLFSSDDLVTMPEQPSIFSTPSISQPMADTSSEDMLRGGFDVTPQMVPQADMVAPQVDMITKGGSSQSLLAPEALESAEGNIVAMSPSVAQRRMAPSAELAPSDQMAPMVLSTPMASADMIVVPGAPSDAGEQYASEDMSPVKLASEEPLSTFSIDVDTASYALARSSLNRGQMPQPDSVRTEEFVNYFDYDYPAPSLDAPAPFSINTDVMAAPWRTDALIMRVGIQGAEVTERKPLDLVFLVDTSGSMNSPDKLGLLQQSLKLALPQLRQGDRIGIVTYAGSAGTALEMTDATDEAAIVAALENLRAGGGTAGQAGLEAAYAMAAKGASEDRTSRVLIATDGDFNVGLSDPSSLEDFIAEKRDTGIYLSVLGFGRGNINDAIMQSLAQNGNGIAGYIDTLSEARKVLVDQFASGAVPIANDVKIQVEFNPAVVQEYRLLGYETRALKREDFNNDKVDAGEIGSGHSVTALYEITPTSSGSALIDPLRYGASDAPAEDADLSEIGQVKLRWKAPGEDASQLITQVVPNEVGEGDTSTRFATAIAGYAQLLRGDALLGDWSFSDAASLARVSRGEDQFGYRFEAVRLIELAEVLKR